MKICSGEDLRASIDGGEYVECKYVHEWGGRIWLQLDGVDEIIDSSRVELKARVCSSSNPLNSIRVNESLHSIEALKKSFHYDHKTGGIFRITKSGRIKDKPIGITKCHGYVVLGYGKRNYQGHRVAWAFVYGKWPDGVIDHINGDKADNRISNLRDVTQNENLKNRRNKGVGVSWEKNIGKWRASITRNGKTNTLGFYETKDEAVSARMKAERFYD